MMMVVRMRNGVKPWKSGFMFSDSVDEFSETDVKLEIDGHRPSERGVKSFRPINKRKSLPVVAQNSNRGSTRSRSWRSRDALSDILKVNETPIPNLNEDEEAVGIITMEDVIEELLQVTGALLFQSSRIFYNSLGALHDISSVLSGGDLRRDRLSGRWFCLSVMFFSVYGKAPAAWTEIPCGNWTLWSPRERKIDR